MENTPRTDSQCPFCEPALSADHNRILRTNESALITLSNPRKAPGHMLVIPKRHVKEPWTLSSKEILDIFELIGFVQQKMIPTLSSGSQVRQNYMPFLPEGQLRVNHVHYHVLPRSFKDPLYTAADIHESVLFEFISEEERARIEPLFR